MEVDDNPDDPREVGYRCDKRGNQLNENDRAFSRLDNPVFFRMGYYNQMKLNKANYMDHKYDVEKWYKFDILLDWDLS